MQSENRGGKWLNRSTPILASLAIVIMLFPAVENAKWRYNHNKSFVESRVVSEYFDSNKDAFFIGATTTLGLHNSYLTPLCTPKTHDNVSDTGGWETLSPFKLDFLRAHGIENPIKDLIDNPKAFYFGEYKVKSLTEYYNKWYCNEGEIIKFINVDEIDGNGVYKVIKYHRE